MINIQHSRWLAPYMVVVVSMCLVGCFATSPSPGKVTLSATPTFSLIVVSPPSRKSPTRTLTLTPSPVLPTVTTLSVYTLAPPTSTPRPTLTADQERVFVAEMLETNGDCELPCWWSITPGKTTWQAAKDQLGLYYGHGTSRPDGMHYEAVYGGTPYTKPLFGYYVAIEFTERSGIVQSIRVVSEVDRNAKAEYFAQDWRHYSPDQVLTRYGEPSQVRIQLVPPIEPGSPVYYEIWLIYDLLGFYIQYLGPAIYEPPIMEVCPRFKEVTEIMLHFQVPQTGESVMESPSIPRSLEKATAMDMETFYETFKNADSDVCFESPVEMWP